MECVDVHSFPVQSEISADVCIIGSGPAGLTLARELSNTGLKIVVLESGAGDHQAWADSLNEIVNAGDPRMMDQTLRRNRVLGGTSSTWSGRTAVFDEVDFAERPWVANSGWPIPRQDVAKYFDRTLYYLGVSVADNTDTSSLWNAIGERPVKPALRPDVFKDYFWPYSIDAAKPKESMRFGPRARKDRLAGVQCILQATVTHIDTDPDGRRVERLEITAPDLSKRYVKAHQTILCGGGIENARLLLASNRILNTGVGNANDNVGRYLMDHLRGPIGYFAPRDHIMMQRYFNNYRVRIGHLKMSMAYGAALTPEIQREEGLLNCAVWIAGSRAANDPCTALSRLLHLDQNMTKNMAQVIAGTGLIVSGLGHFLHRRDALRLMDDLTLECMIEQSPDPDSRVMLAERVDLFGMPLSRIKWRISELEARTGRRMARLFTDEMKRLGLPHPALLEMVTDESLPFRLPDVAHPTGATRMSARPAEGVVDGDCRVHGMSNLYIAGSSVFPTSGHANPTQMIIALAIRLADHLKDLAKAA